MKRILIAGIGNIFLGDDAFGVEVVAELSRHSLPPEVRLKDFGIRSYDLAYELAEGYDAAILIDATPRGEAPGTVFLIEPDLTDLGALALESVDGHDMGPVRVLQMARALGGHPARIYLIGCEPGPLDSPDGRMGLSGAVQAAVQMAVERIQSLIGELLQEQPKVEPGVVPA